MNAQATATASSKAGTSLDGRRFAGIVLECGKTSGDAETISFKNGRFHSSACDAYGYGDGAYTATTNGDAVSFSVETESAKYGKLRWNCVIRGKRLDGTLTMLDGGKVVAEKWVVAGQL
jgi:hypothetical protein